MRKMTYNLLIRDINRVNNVPTATLYTVPVATIVNIYSNLFGSNMGHNMWRMTYDLIIDEIHRANGVPKSTLDSFPDTTVVDIFNNLFGIK